MSQTTTLIVVVGSLATLLLAVPITDDKNQRSSMYLLIGNSNNVNSIRMIHSYQRDNTGLNCEEPGFFADPRNCSQFYRCVDIGETGYFNIFGFECTSGVFYEKSVSCIDGPCPITSHLYEKPSETEEQPKPPVPPPADFPRPLPPTMMRPDPTPPPPNFPPTINPPPSDFPPPIYPDSIPGLSEFPPPIYPDSIPGLSDFPPAPPEPPTPETPDTQKPQSLNELPSWFKETPSWFNTAPSWFQQPPAWFSGLPNPSVIEEDIVIEDSEPTVTDIDAEAGVLPTNNEKNINTGDISISGADATFIKDNKTIRIRIPIHIIQQ